jgi:uncharacterized protein YdiU (UPF0061 family)
VLVRLSHGHIRIGSFQRLATLQDDAGLDALARYALAELYGAAPGENPALQLFGHVVERTARLAASYMAAGFVHGVLNSDNINVTGESFDYGPWRWTPIWDPGFTAAYFDQQGLYAFGRQAQAVHWDVAQLAIALSRIADVEPLAAELDRFPALYEAALVPSLLQRLGVRPRGEAEDLALADAMVGALQSGTVTIDRFFFDWRGGTNRHPNAAYDQPAFHAFAAAVQGYAPAVALDHPYWSDPEPCSMHIEEVEAIWAPIAETDDWSLFTAKVAAIRRMGEALA